MSVLFAIGSTNKTHKIKTLQKIYFYWKKRRRVKISNQFPYIIYNIFWKKLKIMYHLSGMLEEHVLVWIFSKSLSAPFHSPVCQTNNFYSYLPDVSSGKWIKRIILINWNRWESKMRKNETVLEPLHTFTHLERPDIPALWFQFQIRKFWIQNLTNFLILLYKSKILSVFMFIPKLILPI